MRRKILIVGVGNPLLGDEGVGLHAVRSLSQLPMPAEVEILDCGCDLLNLVSYINKPATRLAGKPKKIIILDAIRAGGKPGRIYKFDLDDPALARGQAPPAKAGVIPAPAFAGVNLSPRTRGAGIETIQTTTRSAHQLQAVDALQLLKKVCPCLSHCRIIVMGIEPKTMELSGDLSQEVRESIDDLTRLVREELEASGCSMLDAARGEAVPALRPAGILPAVENKSKMPSPLSDCEVSHGTYKNHGRG